MTPPGRARRLADALCAAIVGAAAWLVLPLSLLLFLQWPLRDVVQAYSREANDLAQIAFALYVAVAITAASRAGAHLATEGLAARWSPRARGRLARAAAAFVQAPWAAFVLFTAMPSVVQSVRQLEAFPDTFNPGYFLVRVALALLATLVVLQALLDVFAGDTDAPA